MLGDVAYKQRLYYNYLQLYKKLAIANSKHSIATIKEEIAAINRSQIYKYKKCTVTSAINSNAINSTPDNSKTNNSNAINSTTDNSKKHNITNITKHLAKHRKPAYANAVKKYRALSEHDRLLAKALPILQRRHSRADFEEIYNDLLAIKSTRRLRVVLEQLSLVNNNIQ